MKKVKARQRRSTSVVLSSAHRGFVAQNALVDGAYFGLAGRMAGTFDAVNEIGRTSRGIRA
jgi:hypothetical protein